MNLINLPVYASEYRNSGVENPQPRQLASGFLSLGLEEYASHPARRGKKTQPRISWVPGSYSGRPRYAGRQATGSISLPFPINPPKNKKALLYPAGCSRMTTAVAPTCIVKTGVLPNTPTD